MLTQGKDKGNIYPMYKRKSLNKQPSMKKGKENENQLGTILSSARHEKF